jgi:hypothetical protein
VNVADARADLYQRLVDAGHPMTPTTGGASPGQLILVAGEPFVQAAQLGRMARTVTFGIVGVVGLASDAASAAGTDAMADRLSTAVAGIADPTEALVWAGGPVSGATPYDIGGMVYIALSTTASTIIIS